MKGRGAVAVFCQPPAGTFVRKKVHVEDPAATAGTNHGRLFAVAVFLDHIENPPPKHPGQCFLGHDRSIRRNKKAIDAKPDSPTEIPRFMEK